MREAIRGSSVVIRGLISGHQWSSVGSSGVVRSHQRSSGVIKGPRLRRAISLHQARELRAPFIKGDEPIAVRIKRASECMHVLDLTLARHLHRT